MSRLEIKELPHSNWRVEVDVRKVFHWRLRFRLWLARGLIIAAGWLCSAGVEFDEAPEMGEGVGEMVDRLLATGDAYMIGVHYAGPLSGRLEEMFAPLDPEGTLYAAGCHFIIDTGEGGE